MGTETKREWITTIQTRRNARADEAKDLVNRAMNAKRSMPTLIRSRSSRAHTSTFLSRLDAIPVLSAS